MLNSAVLRALAKKDSGAQWVHPNSVRMVGNQVGLAREFRNPEAVVSVSRKQGQERRSGIRWIAHRDVQLIGCNDPQLRVTKLPPELVPDGSDLDGARWLRSVLNRMEYSRRSQEQHHNDEDGNDRPGQLNLRTSVHLSRFADGILCSPTELNNGIDQ